MNAPLSVMVFSDLQSHQWQEGLQDAREYDCIAVLRELRKRVEQESPDVLVFNGDLFESKRTLRSDIVSATYAELHSLCRSARNVCLNAGNHDYYRGTCTLDPFIGISKTVHVATRRTGAVAVSIYGWDLLLLPNGCDYAAAEEQHAGRDYAAVFVHDTLAGAVMGNSQRPDTGETQVPAWAFAQTRHKAKALVVAGHYHTPQVLHPYGKDGNVPCLVTGSPIRYNWTDIDDLVPRGYFILEFSRERQHAKVNCAIKRRSLDANFPLFVSSEDKRTKPTDFVLMRDAATVRKLSSHEHDGTQVHKFHGVVGGVLDAKALSHYVVEKKGKDWCRSNRAELSPLIRMGELLLKGGEDVRTD